MSLEGIIGHSWALSVPQRTHRAGMMGDGRESDLYISRSACLMKMDREVAGSVLLFYYINACVPVTMYLKR